MTRSGTTPVPARRFRSSPVREPEWARGAPDHVVVVIAHEGTQQVHSWTPSTGVLVAATARPRGTTEGRIDPTGRWLWWFDDTDGDQIGRWRRQPFGSTPSRRAETPLPLPPAHPAGLLLGEGDLAVVGRADAGGTTVHAVRTGADRAGEPPVLLYAHAGPARVVALSRDDRLVAIQHAENRDARHAALRVVGVDGGPAVADLDDGPGRGLVACGFAPVSGDQRLLVRHERVGAARLLIWDVEQRLQRPVELDVDGEVVAAAWYPDARNVLVTVAHRALPQLYRLDLYSGAVERVGPSDGTVVAAVARPNGDAWVLHSSTAHPRMLSSARTGATLLPTLAPPPSVPVTDV